MNPQQRTKALEAITRMTKGIAAAAGIPEDRAPIIEIGKDNVPATINDAALAHRIGLALESSLGKENVLRGVPIMASEDFSLFALEDPHPPITMFWLGAVDPGAVGAGGAAAAVVFAAGPGQPDGVSGWGDRPA